MSRRRTTLALVIAAVALMPSDVWSGSFLIIARGDAETPVLCIPLEDGASFHLEFINSIYLAPVRETFVYEPVGGIFLSGVESPSAGVFEYYGLMTDGTGRARMRRMVGQIRLKSHDYRHHRLKLNNVTLDLGSLAVNGEPLIIRGARMVESSH